HRPVVSRALQQRGQRPRGGQLGLTRLDDVGLDHPGNGRRTGQTQTDAARRRYGPPDPDDQANEGDEDENRDDQRFHQRATCWFVGLKISGPSWMPARSRRSVNFGRMPVARWKPRTRPSWPIPSCWNVKISCVVTTSSSMPLTSTTRRTFRLP